MRGLIVFYFEVSNEEVDEDDDVDSDTVIDVYDWLPSDLVKHSKTLIIIILICFFEWKKNVILRIFRFFSPKRVVRILQFLNRTSLYS